MFTDEEVEELRCSFALFMGALKEMFGFGYVARPPDAADSLLECCRANRWRLAPPGPLDVVLLTLVERLLSAPRWV